MTRSPTKTKLIEIKEKHREIPMLCALVHAPIYSIHGSRFTVYFSVAFFLVRNPSGPIKETRNGRKTLNCIKWDAPAQKKQPYGWNDSRWATHINTTSASKLYLGFTNICPTITFSFDENDERNEIKERKKKYYFGLFRNRCRLWLAAELVILSVPTSGFLFSVGA